MDEQNKVKNYFEVASMQWEEYHKMQQAAQEQAKASCQIFADTWKMWNSLSSALNQAATTDENTKEEDSSGEEPSEQDEEGERLSSNKSSEDDNEASLPADKGIYSTFSNLVSMMGNTDLLKEAINNKKPPTGVKAFTSLANMF